MKTKIVVFAVLGACAVALGGLAVAAWPQSSASAKEDFCNSLTDFSTTVLNYQGLTPATATDEQLNNAADDISGAWEDVVNDAEDWANAYDNPLKLAYNDLYYEAQSLPDDNTVAEDLEAVDDELSAFPQAFRETFDGSGCSSV